MTNIIEMGRYARNYAPSATSSDNPRDAEEWSRSVSTGVSGALSAAVLRKLDEHSAIGRLMGLIENALDQVQGCIASLEAGDNFAADDLFMGCKKTLSEMLMFRSVSDSIGLLTLKLFQASSAGVVIDSPQMPQIFQITLRRMWASPFMSFDDACELADRIEADYNLPALPGYIDAASALLSSQERSPE